MHAVCEARVVISVEVIKLSKVAKKKHHRIRMNKGFRLDLWWWASFLLAWNRVGMMSGAVKGCFEVTLMSDASESWGCGTLTSSWEWFQLKLLKSGVHITVKELLPIVSGAAVV